MRAFVTIFFAVLATSCSALSTPVALFTPYVPVHPQDEGYFPLQKQFRTVTFPDAPSFPYQHNPDAAGQFVHVTQPQHHSEDEVYLPDEPYLTFVAPSTSLVAYVPVNRGSQGPWAVPNVFIKGQGYSTNQYVAPTVMKQRLAQDPR